MKVSIIVPFYNVEHYFARCLDSIIQQSYQDLEIILVDDCSPDGSYAIAQEYADKDPRIKIIRHEVNKRQGGARNSGMKQASGAYIWFIDSDDTIHSYDAVERLVKEAAAHDHPEIIAFAQIQEPEVESWIYRPLYRGMQPYHCKDDQDFDPERVQSLITGSSSSQWYLRSFLERTNLRFPENSRVWEDAINYFPYFIAQSLLFLPDVYYRYHYVATSTTHQPLDPEKDTLTSFSISLETIAGYLHANQLKRSLMLDKMMVIWLYTLMNLAQSKPHDDARKALLLKTFYLLASIIPDPLRIAQSIADDPKMKNQVRLLQMLANKEHDDGLILKRLKAQKKKIWKSVVQAMLPFGLLQWILSKRGWQVEIKAGKH